MMAKAKKAAAGKKPPVKRTPASNNAKVTIEVVVRNETAVSRAGAKNLTAEPGVANFTYEFVRSGITILNFIVGSYKDDFPEDEGSFFTPVLDPNSKPSIRVVVFARQDQPNGSGELHLSYEGRPVPDSPFTLRFNNGSGGLNERIKLL